MMKDYRKFKESVIRTQICPLWCPISAIVYALVSLYTKIPELDCGAIVFSDSRLIIDLKPVKAHSCWLKSWR